MTNDFIHIVGAGPVGSLLACLIGRQGREVTVWEKRTELPESSMAIGVTPPSLEILDGLGLGGRFRSEGVLIHRARVYENRGERGVLDFRASENAILSLPQSGTLAILREAFQKYPSVDFRFGEAFPGISGATASPPSPSRPWILACDGAKSETRERAGIGLRNKSYGVSFVMADFPDTEGLGPDARLYFSARGAVESFPLPGSRRRWIAQAAPGTPPDLNHLLNRVRDAAGIDLAGREHTPLWPFEPTRALAETYVKGNVILCGDAAHVMSPIGGQGMNTGFADAALLAEILRDPSPAALRAYTRQRRRAFRAASRRAAAGMWLGTRAGPAWSRVRGGLIAAALRFPPSHHTLARTFSMRNLPRTSGAGG